MFRPITSTAPHVWGMRLLVLLVTAGCHTWHEPQNRALALPAARMSADAVVFEITFVRLSSPSGQEHQEIWADIDEQQEALADRRRLNANGFRYGVVGWQLPPALQSLLDRERPETTGDGSFQAVTALATTRRIQLRAGQRSEIVTGRPWPRMSILYRDGDQVNGAILYDAQCLLAAKSVPQSDGRVQIELVPEIHFGPTRNRWIAENGVFRLQAGRDRRVFSDLRIQATLSPGQSLAIGTTAQATGLGSRFFVEGDDGTSQQKLLLIRLAQVQYDDLFDDPARRTGVQHPPLVSPQPRPDNAFQAGTPEQAGGTDG